MSWEAMIKTDTTGFYCMKMQIEDNGQKYQYYCVLIDFMVPANYRLMDNSELRQITQPSTTGSPLGD